MCFIDVNVDYYNHHYSGMDTAFVIDLRAMLAWLLMCFTR